MSKKSIKIPADLTILECVTGIQSCQRTTYVNYNIDPKKWQEYMYQIEPWTIKRFVKLNWLKYKDQTIMRY